MSFTPFRVLALVPDLLTNVRIESGAQRLGGFVQVVEDPTAFVHELMIERPELAIVDLGLDWVDLDEVVRACARAEVPLLAFGPHVDTGRLRQARAAGVDFVYPRSRFMTDVTGTLREAMAGVRA
jgi:AmiR/NasT family two-component response regulator